jgi:phosphoserine phosphatase RsbU/P
MKVLVADDDLITRRLLESVLQTWGYEVCTAVNGEEALRTLTREDHPEMALIDWQMPIMDGPEVCRSARAALLSDSLHIILLTSVGGSQNIINGLRSGADDYVTKPFNRDELRARLDVGRRIVQLQHNLATRVKQLEDALTHVKQLQGLLPICSYCKKIRNDRNYWQQVETFIHEHSEAKFSHGICPDCYEKFVQPELNSFTGE